VNHLLWDIDGTLVRNSSTPGIQYHLAVERALGRSLENRVAATHGHTDAYLVAATLAAHGLGNDYAAIVTGHLDDITREQHEAGQRRVAAPGVAAAVAGAASAGWTNAILTGNGPLRSRLKVEGAGIDVELFDWEHSYFGHQTPVRADITRRAAAELGASAVIVGDTPNDGAAAEAAGMGFIAVATGAYSAEELRQTSALAVLDDLESGLDEFLAVLARLAR
jgi:phosphoglycolate phosphatase-like HAD superfamily hydrolase